MYILNNGDKEPECGQGRTHDWFVVIVPKDDYSGWYEKRCKHCGAQVAWDDSD